MKNPKARRVDFSPKSKVTEEAQLTSSKESNGKGEQFPRVIPDDNDSISTLTSLGLHLSQHRNHNSTLIPFKFRQAYAKPAWLTKVFNYSGKPPLRLPGFHFQFSPPARGVPGEM